MRSDQTQAKRFEPRRPRRPVEFPISVRFGGGAQNLEALGWLCLELARAPQLPPVFLRVIELAPRTVAELRRRDA